MKKQLLIFTALLLVVSCSPNNSNSSHRKDTSNNENYWETFPKVTLPEEYYYTFYTDMGGGANIEAVDSIFFHQYLSHEAISKMVQNYFNENYPELPLLKYYEGGHHNRVSKIGRLCSLEPDTQHILASFSFSNQKWFHRYLFILVFKNKKLIGKFLIAGECFTVKGEVPKEDQFAYEVDGSLDKIDKGDLIIKRKFKKLASKEYRHVSQGVGKVLETFKDSTEVEIR